MIPVAEEVKPEVPVTPQQTPAESVIIEPLERADSFIPQHQILAKIGALLSSFRLPGSPNIHPRQGSEHTPDAIRYALPVLGARDIDSLIHLVKKHGELQNWVLPGTEIGREFIAHKFLHKKDTKNPEAAAKLLATRLGEAFVIKKLTGSGALAAMLEVVMDNDEINADPNSMLGVIFHVLAAFSIDGITTNIVDYIIEQILITRFVNTQLDYRKALTRDEHRREIDATFYAIRQLPRRDLRMLRRDFKRAHPEIKYKNRYQLDAYIAQSVHRYTMNVLYPAGEPSTETRKLQLCAALNSIYVEPTNTGVEVYKSGPIIAGELIAVAEQDRLQFPEKYSRAGKAYMQFHEDLAKIHTAD